MRPVTSPSSGSNHVPDHAPHHRPKFILLHGSDVSPMAISVFEKLVNDRTMPSSIIDASRLPEGQTVRQIASHMLPGDHLLINAHGTVDLTQDDDTSPTHKLKLAKQDAPVATQTALSEIVSQLGAATARTRRSEGKLPFIYLFSCNAGSLRDEISPDSELWKRANLMIFAGKRPTSLETSTQSVTGAITYVHHCERNNQPVDPMKLLYFAGASRGDSVTLMGGNLTAPLVWHAPKSTNGQCQIWNLRGDKVDVNRFGHSMGTLQPEELECLPQASPKEVMFNRLIRNDSASGKAMLAAHPELLLMKTSDGISLITASIALQTSDFSRMLLVEAGADANVLSPDGGTPLIHAILDTAGAPKIEDLELLLQHGADPNRQNDKGTTALIAACKSGHTEAVVTLLKGGANPDLFDSTGATALILATELSDIDAMRILLEADADPNLQDIEGNTALMRAIENDNEEAVGLLLKHNVRLDLSNKEGNRCVDLACKSEHTNVLRRLLAAGAGPSAGLTRDLIRYSLLNGRAPHAYLMDNALELIEPTVFF